MHAKQREPETSSVAEILPPMREAAAEAMYWIARQGNVRGPYPIAEIRRMAVAGGVRPEDGCSPDRQRWASIASILGGVGPRVDAAHPPRPGAGISPGELLSLQDELVGETLRKAAIDHPNWFVEALIPAGAVQAARRAYAFGNDRIIALFDATGGGPADQGFVITARGVMWRLAPEATSLALGGAAAAISLGSLSSLAGLSPAHGKSTPLSGALPFQNMPPGRPLTIAGSKLQFGAVNSLYLPQLEEASIESLADFFMEACAIAQRRSPRLAIREGESLARRGESEASVETIRRALHQDVTLAGEAQAAAERLGPLQGPLAKFRQELMDMTSDSERFWHLRRPDAGAEGPLPLSNIKTMAVECRLFADDELLRFGDTAWRPLIDSELLPPRMRLCYRDCGRATAEQFQAAHAALTAAAGAEKSILLACAAQSPPGGPVRVVGLTVDDLFIVTLAANLAPKVDRDSWDSAIWSLLPAPHAPGARLTVAMASGGFEIILSPGCGLAALRDVSSRLFCERAGASIERHELVLAERLLNQVSTAGGERALESNRLRDKIGKQAEVIAVYDGGHPAMMDRTLGALRIDSLGMEFASIVPGEATRMRLTYEQLREVSPPARGALPEEMAKKVAQSDRTTQLLKTGLAFGAASVIPGGSLLVNGLMGGKKAEAPPQNRLCVVAEIEGATYRLFFEVVADRREDLDRQAKAFWAASNQVRKRFGKARSSAGAGSRETSEQTALLREIRDLMRELVEKDKGTTRETPSSEGNVVACPRCATRMRVKSPGVVACPNCQQKVRVSASHFERGE